MHPAINTVARRTLWILAALALLSAGLLWVVWDILAPIAICLVLVYLVEPLVTRLAKQRVFGWQISRGIAVAALFACALVTVATLVMVLLPRFYSELARMAHELPRQLGTLRQVYIPQWEAMLQTFSDQWGLGLNAHKVFHDGITNLMQSSEVEAKTLTATVRHLVAGVFQTLMTVILVLIVSAFLLRDAPRIRASFWTMVPPTARNDIKALTTALSRDLDGAIRGQLLICLINGILTTVGLMVLQVNYAVTIGLIAGICSLIPVVGTIISTIPAVLVAVTQSWKMALEAVGLILLIHLIEANYLNPKVMGHNVELHPAIILTSLFVAEHYFGIAGLLLAVPCVAAVRSVVHFVYTRYVSLPYDLPPDADGHTAAVPQPILPPDAAELPST